MQNQLCISPNIKTVKYRPQLAFHFRKVKMAEAIAAEDLPLHYFNLPNDVSIDPEGSEIVKFLSGKNVLITGGTGFLGKLLIEKLLRCCEDIGYIYLLIRSKNGKDCQSRAEDLFLNDVFEPMRKLRPKYLNKVIGISGDCSLPGLDLSPEDRNTLINNVHIIHHAAATVRFNEKLRVAFNINVRGTLEVLTLAKQCKQLQSFVHWSTAYSNCPNQTITESFYSPPVSYEEFSEIITKFSDKKLDGLTAQLIAPWPNTYSFTKCLAEDLVKNLSPEIPTAVFRPAIVIATKSEPLRGWNETLFGPTGLTIGVAIGLLRTFICAKKARIEIVPADYVTNSAIAVSWKACRETGRVYNMVCAPENSLSIKQYMDTMYKYREAVPSVNALWYSFEFSTKSLYLYRINHFLLHLVPAAFVDFYFVCCGRKPKLLKVYGKVNKFIQINAFFTTRQWNFVDENLRKLWDELGEADKKAFPFSMKDLDWEEFNRTHVVGLRKYVVKEDLETIPEARKRMKKLRIAHEGVKIVLLGLVFGLFWILGSYLRF